MEKKIDPVIQFVISQQESDGGFPTYESYPVVNPAAGWTKLPDASPFITANILFSLIQLRDAQLDAAISKGAKSLASLKEGKGFWRFWPVKSKQHPVPLDMDDTCIVRFVLSRCGYNDYAKDILLNNKNAEGYFETWLGPRVSNFPISPTIAFAFVLDYFIARPTLKLKHFTYKDKEPAVAANALLYLGENAGTQACINQVILEITSGKIPLQFYDDEIVVYYHIARAFKNGISSFEKLGTIMAERICARFETSLHENNNMLWAMAANVLFDYNRDIELAEKMIDRIMNGNAYPDKWGCHPYFCSKDRNFLSGSPGLTAAVFAEACSKLNSHKLK